MTIEERARVIVSEVVEPNWPVGGHIALLELSIAQALRDERKAALEDVVALGTLRTNSAQRYAEACSGERALSFTLQAEALRLFTSEILALKDTPEDTK